MNPVTQTKVVVKNSAGDIVVKGNCFAAVIASLVDVPITEVPNVETLFDIDGVSWYGVMESWLIGNGWKIVTNGWYNVFHNPASYNEDTRNTVLEDLKDKYYIATGMSPRGVSHVCIYQNGKMVHDPHPTREGIDESTIQYFEEIVKL